MTRTTTICRLILLLGTLPLAGCQPSDHDLQTAVEVRLAMGGAPPSIEVTVTDRVARLRGESATREEQRRARELAASVEGIAEVVSEVRLSDAVIKAAVERALAQEPLLAGVPFEVIVSRGVVRLESPATDRVQRARAIGTTAQIDGVVRIDDFMK
jgi:osmotically-inducible protein OsmY